MARCVEVWSCRFGELESCWAFFRNVEVVILSFVLDAVEHNMRGRGPGIDIGLVLLLVACCLLPVWKYGSVRLRSQVIAQLPLERYLKY